MNILQLQRAGHDGDGDGEAARRRAGGERGHQRAGAGGVGRGPEHQHGDVLVLVDELADLLALGALADDLLGGHVLESRRD